MATDKLSQAQSSSPSGSGCLLTFVLGIVGIACGFATAWMAETLTPPRPRPENPKLDGFDALFLYVACMFGGGLVGAIVGAVVGVWYHRPFHGDHRTHRE